MDGVLIYIGLVIVAWQLGKIAKAVAALSPKNTESEHD